MLKKTYVILIVCGLMLGVGSAGCRRGSKVDNGPEEDTGKPKYRSSGDEGTVSGKIAFQGPPPTPRKIDMGAEPSCAQKNPNAVSEEVLVKDGSLENVFVYLQGGPAGRFTFDVPSTPVTLDQSGCHYVPHVMGIMTQQTLKIVNSDPVNHNVHPTPRVNPEWNESQGPGTDPKEKKFNRQETLVPIKCNIHPWMKAHIGVLPHPFYAVSGEDGTYRIANVPPGDYTLIAWHEKYGEKSEKVKVDAKGAVTKDFTFSEGQAYVPTSLKVEPALLLPCCSGH